MSNLIGQSLGRYHLIKRLGEGGMAVVYKAFDTRLETDVAVKIIRTEKLTEETKERSLKRFEREAKALARLTHPNIVKVTDYGDHDGKPYLVMPLLAGGTLKGRLGKPIPWDEAFQILSPIAWALEYAHGRDIIHRDVKPSNILITDSGQPMISDFGVAKILTLEETVDLTGTGMGIGTPEYMAPEQWTGNTTPHSDQYSLGVVLYEMITGRKPYTADTPAAILLKQATEPLPRPSALVSGLPGKVEKLLIKTLARDPKDRYKDMGELAKALEGGLKSIAPVERAKPQSAAKPKEKVLDTLATVDQEWDEPKTLQTVSSSKRKTRGISPVNKVAKKSSVVPLIYMILGLSILVSCILTVGVLMFNNYRQNPTEIVDALGIPMRLVRAGEFTMGSNDQYNDQPVHQVYLGAFYMDTYEVTNARYKECVNTGVCDPPKNVSSYSRSHYYGNSQYDNYPVIWVNWYQAQAYYEWRSARLPTEAEWEKAARGTNGRIWPWGNSFDGNRLNFCDRNCEFKWKNPSSDDGYADTAPVGTYKRGKSIYGLYDMAGNVWEWVADWYDKNYYASSPFSNPQGPSSGEYRVVRGGAWNEEVNLIRSDSRMWNDPSDTDNYMGFRCSLSP
jgi:eukaryotic-like serine/threonine-protein kinase